MKSLDKAIGWFDRLQRRHKLAGFPLAVVKKYGEDEASHQAALLAYYGFLALFPLLLALTSFTKLVIHGNPGLQDRIITAATKYLPVIGTEIQHSVHTLSGTGLQLVVGIVLTFVGARGVADALRGGINHVWQVPYVRRSGFPRSLLQSLCILLVGALGLILAPLLSGFAVSLGGHSLAVRALALLLAIAILFGAFLVLVRIALPMHVRLRDLVPAAATAAIGLSVLQLVGGYLVTHQLSHFTTLYGTFALVLGLLYWLHLQAKVFFYSLEAASVRALRLWPRAIDQKHLTDQDRRAFRLYASRNRYHHDEAAETTASGSD